MDIVWVPKFAAAGWMLDLTNKISPQQLSKFIKGNVEGGRYRGKLYRIPHASDAGMFYYRKDILEHAGIKPPQTFEEMFSISQNLQKQGKTTWGYLWQGKQYEGVSAMFVEVLAGFGGFWANPDTFKNKQHEIRHNATARTKNRMDISSTSFKVNADISAIPNVYIPKRITFEHYLSLFRRRPFGLYII